MSGDRGPLRTAVENWWNDWNPAGRFGEYVSGRMLAFGKSMLTIEHRLFDKYITNPKTRALFKELFTEPPTEGYEGGVILYVVGGIVAAVLGIQNYGVSVQRLQRRIGNVNDPNEKLDFGHVILLYLRGGIGEAEFSTRCYEYGYSDEERALFIKASMQLLDPMSYVIMYRRQASTLDEYYKNMKAIGYDKDQADQLISVTEVIPGVQDLIGMQVREAFNPEIIARFQLDQGDRSKVKEHAGKQGLSEYWVDRYWNAHFQYPSVQMGIEMFHRLREGELQFTENDLDLLMAASDIPPFFRKRILAVSEALLTRVDIRRLYQAGLFKGGIDDLVKAYRDLGYGPDKAQMLAEFAARGASEDEKDLTRADIVGAYTDGILDEGETKSNLVKMGYDQPEAQIIVDRANLDIAKQELAKVREYIKQRYQRGTITDLQAKSELGTYGLKAETMDGLILSWTREKKMSTTMPTQSKAETWYIKDIIDLAQYTEYLVTLNYGEKEIGFLLADADRKKAAGTAEEGA